MLKDLTLAPVSLRPAYQSGLQAEALADGSAILRSGAASLGK